MKRRGADVPTHYLRTNEREWTPAHVLYVDTETRQTETDRGELHTLRCWVACRIDRREQRKTEPVEIWGEGFDRESLAGWVSAATRARRSTWLWTHNLGFDLAVTDLLGELVKRGWWVGDWSANDRATWFRLSLGDRGLTVCDSVTWLNKGLDEIGPMVGVGKVPLPRNDAPVESWLDRCRGDVSILSKAMGTLLDWWDTANLGNWSLTGNGCGWNAMRHQVPKRAVLVRTGDGGRELERQAIYGGRRDACRWGDVDGGPFVTIDFEAAYATICANLRLPARRLGQFDTLPVDDPAIGDGAIQCLAEVEVTTNVPRYPVRANGAVWYPVGQFVTTLAGPEIREARDRGELVAIRRGFRYFCDGHLMGWARWVIELSNNLIPNAPTLASLCGKRWGRSVPGRFASRIGEAEHVGPALAIGWQAIDGGDVTSGCPLRVVDMAGERYLVRQDQEADDSFPAVLAWVESYTRLRLNRLLDFMGEGAWVSCNTDGAIIDLARLPVGLLEAIGGPAVPKTPAGRVGAICDHLAPLTAPLVARPKDSFSSMWLAGPATIERDGRPVMSGIPAAAKPGDDGKLHAHLWPGLSWQMSHGDRRGYVRPLQSYSVPTVTVHRWAATNGAAVPVESFTDSTGATCLVPSPPAPVVMIHGGASSVQSRAVARLAGGRPAVAAPLAG